MFISHKYKVIFVHIQRTGGNIADIKMAINAPILIRSNNDHITISDEDTEEWLL